MGAFTKSIAILLVALSIPLVYRQFADDGTVKFMSTYYSNFKSIDQFLRKSASHLDKAKAYLPDSVQLKGAVNSLSGRFNEVLEASKAKLSQMQSDTKVSEESESQIRWSNCPGEDLKGQKIRLWSKQELARYGGDSAEGDIYLAFLGLVYNVTINQQHYAKGSEYNSFTGRDATRAFITGNFTHDLSDDIRDVDTKHYPHVESWDSFYKSGYPIVGRLEGSFYDSRGCVTDELKRVYHAFETYEEDKAAKKELDRELPECNSEWNGDTKSGKVWCSTKSGGIEREWEGVPRIYNNGESSRCVCFNSGGQYAAEFSKHLVTYPGCNPSAIECALKE